mgnify:CR=1 FL=1
MLGTVVIDRETYGKTMMRMALSLAETGRTPEDISLEEEHISGVLPILRYEREG